MKRSRSVCWMVLLLAATACSKTPATESGAGVAAPIDASALVSDDAVAIGATDAAALPAEAAPEFPAIPVIVVPDIVGVTPAQRAFEGAMRDVADPIPGMRVRPATCGTDGALVNDAGVTSVDADGNVVRNSAAGVFQIAADGSGTANFDGGIVTINADGSGTINGSGEADGGDAIIAVEADGAGSYNGRHGIIQLDGHGGGTWNGDGGVITNNGDGSGTWNGPQGIVTINNDGSGTWNGPQGLVINEGDGSGRVGTPGREVAMAPLPRVAPAGRFPPLQRFAPAGLPCGFVVTLDASVLFDFDKSDLRPDATHVLDTVGRALHEVASSGIEIRGHTDSKGSDDYNQSLSERRAHAVLDALRQRGAALQAQATGYGESQPLAPNEMHGLDHPAGRQLNRRVEIVVHP